MERLKFVNLIDRLSNIAKRDKWETSYNKALDHLYWVNPNLSPEARLVKLSHETSAYITPKGNLEGVFVEYLNQNFLTHNPTVEENLRGFLNGEVDSNDPKLSTFAESLRADIYKDALDNDYNSKDLEQLIVSAVSS
jgi:hypothetical protein